MRFRNIILLLFCLPTAGLAQNTNDWIDFSQTYYRISIASDGIYRLTYNDLLAAGMPVNAVDPRLIQLFHRGEEQAVFFKHDQSPADPSFDPAEYLEFYGRKNDGTLDAKLYEPASVQPNQFFNLYSDTTAYFLTWNSFPVQGKRMELFDQVNSTGLPKEIAHANEQLLVFTNEYCGGDVLEKFITQSFFDQGEGWTGPTICTNSGCTGQQDFQIELLNNGVQLSGIPTLEFQLAGRDHLLHRAEIHAGPTAGNLRLITIADFQNFQTPVLSSPLDWSDIGVDGKMIVRVKALGVGGIRDRLSVSYLRVTFPQNFDMSGISEKQLYVNPNAGGKSYIELDNAVSGARIWDVTLPSGVVIIGTRTNANILSAIVPNTTVKRHLLVSVVSNSVSASQIKKISFRELDPSSQFLIVSHESLMQPAMGYSNPVQAFAAYRASPEGGDYDTLTVTIDQLYNQFNYGETSPTAIYEFMLFMIANGDPKYLFLVGKGRDVSSGFHRKTVLAPGELKDLVPTAGTPASDMTFTAGMSSEEFVPAVSTGRLTASTPQQVAAYLNKVKEAEAVPFQQLWRKKILHLSGGIQANELTLFRQYMNGFADIAKGPFLGGEVITVAKHDASAVEFINISKEINEGLNFVTFFGHSSSSATDIDIGNVSEPILGYNNPGKYPAFLVNGCNAGEFFTNGTLFGEDWIMASNKGARSFIANSGFGFDGLLRYYTTLFYEVAFADSVFLNKGVGDVQKEVARRFLSGAGDTPSIFTAQVQQMVLLGDPSVRLFSPTKPDFEITDASITATAFDDKPIHALTDSIEIRIIVKNLGRVVNKPLHVRVRHTIGEALFQYDSLFESVLFQDTLRFAINRGATGFFGLNVLEVTLDPLEVIAELVEDNNSGFWNKFISFNGTMNLQPQDFGIVSSNEVELVFQDTDLRSPEKTYILELDSSLSFNSGFLTTQTIQAKVLSRNHFMLPDIDSTVYYWRTKIQGQPDDQWETTSFAYIQGSPEGWAQIRFDQLTENSFSGLVPDAVQMKMDFEPTAVSIFVKTFGSNSPTPSVNGSFQVDHAEYYFSPQGFNCRDNTINLVAFDRSTVVPYLGVPFTFQNSGGRACGREPQLINSFMATETDTGNNDDLIQYIDNVKVSDSVVLFAMGDAGFSSWSPDVKLKLSELGISGSDIDTFLPGEPVIILARKGSPPGSAKIFRSDQPLPQEQELQLSEEIQGHVTAGTVKSVVVGPAVLWKTVFPSIQSVESNDIIGIDLYGIMKDGKEVLLLSDRQQQFSIEAINPLVYPFLKLAYKAEDDTNLTPAQLKKWIVTFDPAPDGLLVFKDPPGQLSLPEGSLLQLNFGFVNISNKPFLDSLEVYFAAFNKAARTTQSENFKIKGPAPGDTSSFITHTNTRFNLGWNDLNVVVNDHVMVEQYYQNNSIELVNYVDVTKDKSNPILDVTFDGRYLANGDYVSSNPFILIKVKDENPLLLQTDTTGVLILLRYPCAVEDCDATRVNLSGKEIKWFPATSSNEFRIEFNPENLKDGTYTLFVLAEDVSGNPSGEVPYEVSFKVSSEPAVIFAPPYPNPSPAGFYFEFQVSGKTPPQALLLQIFNRNGQLVAAYNEEETPLSKVGRNQLKWPGLDEQGNRLSDGIYLYRLSVNAGEKEFRSSGRLMILR